MRKDVRKIIFLQDGVEEMPGLERGRGIPALPVAWILTPGPLGKAHLRFLLPTKQASITYSQLKVLKYRHEQHQSWSADFVAETICRGYFILLDTARLVADVYSELCARVERGGWS